MENLDPKNPLRFQFGLAKPTVPPQLPLRILVIADIGGHSSMGSTQPFLLNRDNFNSVFTQCAPSIDLIYEHQGMPSLHYRHTFKHWSQWQPKGFVTDILPLAELYALHKLLLQYTERRVSLAHINQAITQMQPSEVLSHWLPQIRQAIGANQRDMSDRAPQTQPHPHPPIANTNLDSLFDLVDTKADSTPPRSTGIGQVMEHITANRRSAPPTALADILQKLQSCMQQWIDQTLHCAAWLKLEQSWRGLRFLCERAQANTQLSIQPSRSDQILPTLEQITNTAQDVEAPINLIVIDHMYKHRDADLEEMTHIAQWADRVQIPVLASLDLKFFGEQGVVGMTLPTEHLQQSGFEKWQSLRQKAASRWLALACNRFLLREPYEAVKNPSYNESIMQLDHLLWGHPAWVVTSLVMQSFDQTQWPTEINGQSRSMDQMVLAPALPIRGLFPHSALEAVLTVDLAEQIGLAGIIPLMSPKGRDHVFLALSQSVHAMPNFADVQFNRQMRYLTSFGYQLLLNRVIGALLHYRHLLTGQADGLDLPIWEHFLTQLMLSTGRGASVKVAKLVNEGRPYLHIEMTTGQQVMHGVPIEFDLPMLD